MAQKKVLHKSFDEETQIASQFKPIIKGIGQADYVF